MSTEAIIQLAASGLVGLLVFFARRSLGDIEKQVTTIATDVRQLASQGARHGEALAGGVVKFQGIEKRLDKLETKQEQFQADCIACRTERHS